ncbi:non-ribosomal peptide synthetase [Paenibacillus macquariensis]|uniref:Fengycin family lipopeptide synthetase D n=1 Tax=Paenibacillus macquariensis TaxID=948756 RepID=A0ABY1K2N5_9BACL|nr:non-ribosomal peptide synthetase [Paenibacillus macquariensis]MEC0090208.1 non-ribosomal peptide synthetase [Paenibacillus macquariensis]OAB39580.1 hypothetical protein PMSM_00145 [Paenibacillus macquariensis subsp. macquariensis]SIR17398.1 fengycin family lipopeptide synthetase D [Paenibacillus macquariensis]
MNDILKWISGLSTEQRKFFEQFQKEDEVWENEYTPHEHRTRNCIEIAVKKEYYPATYAQKRMFIMNQLEGLDPSYNISRAFVIKGELDKQRLHNAFMEIVCRHEALRTSFELIEGEIVQKIHTAIDFEISEIEVREHDVEGVLRQFIRPFNLSQAPLLRVGLLKLSDHTHILVYDKSHIISDGVSTSILIKEFLSQYNGQKLQAIKLQYKDFSEWQNKLVESVEMKKKEDFWLEMYRKEPTLLKLPIDFPRLGMKDYKGESFECNVSEETGAKLKEFAARENTSLFALLLAAYKIMLSKVSSTDDVIVGIPSAGRAHPEVQNVIGMFVNTLPIRSNPDEMKTFPEYVEEVKNILTNAIDNQDYQYDMLLHRLGIKMDKERNPLFDTIFNSQNFAADERILNENNRDHLSFTSLEFENKTTTSDLTIYYSDYNGIIRFLCTYRTSIFKNTTIEYMMGEYIKLLGIIADQPAKLIKDYKIFSRTSLRQRNNTLMATPYEHFELVNERISIADCFEKQAEKFAFKTAIKSLSGELSYSSLNMRANRITQYILDSRGNTNATAALLFEHRSDMIIGILGVVKSGKIFVPLDLNFPEERLAYMLKDSGADIVLCNSNTISLARKLKDLHGDSIEIVNIESISNSNPSENPRLNINPDQPAFILYTSGSTGKPKGVVQNHIHFLKLMRSYINNLHINSEDRLVLLTSYSHAVGIIDIFSTLLTGGTIYPFDLKTDGNLKDLATFMEKEKITIFHSVPTIYRYFINELSEGEIVKHLRLVVLGGEAVLKTDAEKYIKYFNDKCLLVNFLGASEVMVATFKFVDKHIELSGETVSAGYPIDEVNVLIVNENNEEARTYEEGEIIYVSECLSLGYWNLPHATANVFVPNPLAHEGRVYRSGDLGRILPDGSIEYIGRKDNQVKIRGQRVELNEIEMIMDEIKGIQKSIVTAVKENIDNTVLVGYFVPGDGIHISIHELKQKLASKLPLYMVPAYFMPLDELPLTPSGKIDRNKLSHLDTSKVSAHEYTAPTNDIEKTLADIWMDVLENEAIGIHDGFFDIGGNSLKILKVHYKLDQIYPGKLTVIDMFSNPTIYALAQKIQSVVSSKADNISIQSIILPPAYFTYREAESNFYVFKLSIIDPLFNKMKAIALHENIQVMDIAVSMCIYSLAEISNQEEVTIQTMLKEKGNISPLTINLTKIERIEELLHTVREMVQHENRYDTYHINEVKKIKRQHNKFAIVPIFADKSLLCATDSLWDWYDVIFKVDVDAQGLNLLCEFSRQLTYESAKYIADNYVMAIEALVERFDH